MIKINIDNKEVLAQPGQMLIDVADSAGISIPRFCYHPKLSVAANCRMCLVEISGLKKNVPACATAIFEGMVVRTQSENVKKSQRSVMEFLLVNHPLDCPICDQGGECELQDVAMDYGQVNSRFLEPKRVIKEKDIGPLIQTDLTRCIHCTRCVRFGQEIAGIMELGMSGRGEHAEISSFLEKGVSSEMSGNMIDICPVGALTSKPFRYLARPWEISARPSIAGNDSSGANLYCHVKNDKILRVVPAQNDAINETWLSDKDRFSYEGVNSSNRLLKPMLKISEDFWQEREWDEILPIVVEKLRESKGDLMTLVSPDRTLEEMHLSQKLTRALGSEVLGHRLHQRDFSQQDKWPNYPISPVTFEEIEKTDCAFIIGSNLCFEHPMINHRLRKMTQAYLGNEKRVWQLNESDFSLRMPNHALIAHAENWLYEIAAVLKAVLEQSQSPEAVQKISELNLYEVDINEHHKALSQQLLASENALIMLGNLSSRTDNFDDLIAWVKVLANEVDGKWLWLPTGANSIGAWKAGCIFQGQSSSKKSTTSASDNEYSQMLEKKYHTMLGVGVEFGVDFNGRAENTIALTTHYTAGLHQYADILLPVTCIEESAGTMINLQGDWQSFNAVVNPVGEATPAWKVLRVLANSLSIEGFEYTSSKDIYKEITALEDESNAVQKDWQHQAQPLVSKKEEDFSLHGQEEFSIFSLDIENENLNFDVHALKRLYYIHSYNENTVLRHASSLQKTQYAQEHNAIRLHPNTLETLGGLQSLVAHFADYNDFQCEISLVSDVYCKENTLYFPHVIHVKKNARQEYENSYQFSYFPARNISKLVAEDQFILNLS